LQTFAGRAGAELERQQADEKLRAMFVEVERLKSQLQAENVYLQEEIRREHNFHEMVGNSPPLLEALHKVERVAPIDSTVLILGETGSGKELFARAVHNRSKRSHRPLVKVNCGSIAPGLIESELFGHVKGAFTGAIDKRVGRFELADGGTIFLDEIGELPLDAQSSCCECSRNRSSNRSAAAARFESACASSPRPIAISNKRFATDVFAPTCCTG
jgi:transcriptional regulator with GAF, ATPase, and Fis domain